MAEAKIEPGNGVVELEELKRRIAEAGDADAKSAASEIQAVLAKYSCQMGALAELTPDGRIATRIVIQKAK